MNEILNNIVTPLQGEPKRPIRVLFLGKNTSRGGSMRVLSYILKYLDPKRFMPTVIVPEGGDLLPVYRRYATTYVYAEYRRGAYFRALQKIINDGCLPSFFRNVFESLLKNPKEMFEERWLHSKIRLVQPDMVVHYHHSPISLYKSVKKLDVPTIQTLSMYGMALNSLGGSKLEKIVRRADHFICQGKNVLEYAHNCLGIPLEKISKICVGVDLAVKDEQLNLPNRVHRLDLGFNEDDLIVGACGPVNYHKGVDIWLKAAAILLAGSNSVPIKFMWVGGTKMQFQSIYGKSVLSLCKELGLENNVQITGDRPSVYPFINLCDIYTQPSRDDAFPHAMLEAMALRKPCVAFRQGVAAEEYAAGMMICVDGASPEALAAGIKKLIDQPSRRRELGKSARDLIQSRFEADENVRSYQAVLEDVYKQKLKVRHRV